MRIHFNKNNLYFLPEIMKIKLSKKLFNICYLYLLFLTNSTSFNEIGNSLPRSIFKTVNLESFQFIVNVHEIWNFWHEFAISAYIK